MNNLKYEAILSSRRFVTDEPRRYGHEVWFYQTFKLHSGRLVRYYLGSLSFDRETAIENAMRTARSGIKKEPEVLELINKMKAKKKSKRKKLDKK